MLGLSVEIQPTPLSCVGTPSSHKPNALRRSPLIDRPMAKLRVGPSGLCVSTTPGSSCNSDTTLRPLIIRLSTCWLVNTPDFSELAVCTVAPWDSTLIRSLTAPTSSAMAPRDNRSLALRTRPARSSRLKPAASTATLYVPGPTALNAKSPLADVANLRVAPVLVWVKVTDPPRWRAPRDR